MSSKIIDTIKKNIDTIKNTFIYTNYIRHVIFDNYANIKPASVLNLSFPLTALVGKNGCNKTRILQALYGIPKGKTVGDYWFSTSLDIIADDTELGHPRYTYVYSDNNDASKLYPVIYYHVQRKRNSELIDPDYWETSPPTASMKAQYNISDRCSPIDKNMVYIDSKIELSAYDICFNFNSRHENRSTDYRNNKAFIRKKSSWLKTNIRSGTITKCNMRPQNDMPFPISPEVLKEISQILGKDYSTATQIFHKHYNFWGDSLFFNGKYSEAHAGSGELKVFNMVQRILAAPHHSLILLDEPEISLHPGAQLTLLNFLLEQIIKKKHQVIFTTHSPTIVNQLPSSAIKLLTKLPADKYFSIYENIDYQVAFEDFGEPVVDNTRTIIVEDETAKKVLESVIASSEKLGSETFSIKYPPGGADTILTKYIPSIMDTVDNLFIILDGDKKPKDDARSYGKISLEEKNSSDYLELLKNIIFEQTGTNADNISFFKNSDTSSKSDKLIQIYETYLSFLESHVRYLPANTPEDIIWSTDIDTGIFSFNGKDLLGLIESRSDLKESKSKILECAKLLSGQTEGQSAQIYPIVVEQLVSHFVTTKNKDYSFIENMLQCIQNI